LHSPASETQEKIQVNKCTKADLKIELFDSQGRNEIAGSEQLQL